MCLCILCIILIYSFSGCIAHVCTLHTCVYAHMCIRVIIHIYVYMCEGSTRAGYMFEHVCFRACCHTCMPMCACVPFCGCLPLAALQGSRLTPVNFHPWGLLNAEHACRLDPPRTLRSKSLYLLQCVPDSISPCQPRYSLSVMGGVSMIHSLFIIPVLLPEITAS